LQFDVRKGIMKVCPSGQLGLKVSRATMCFFTDPDARSPAGIMRKGTTLI